MKTRNTGVWTIYIFVNESKLDKNQKWLGFNKMRPHSRQLVHLEQSSEGPLLAAAALPANQNDPYL